MSMQDLLEGDGAVKHEMYYRPSSKSSPKLYHATWRNQGLMRAEQMLLKC